ncbi:hypothetical protein L6452_22139 [Arctium lappa]|uniref:Uncharacterized protein n=1 Tax=Arctium lappa TaxID=4217 RepID=A0ACB9AY54_ARCLA|nr:hypothetical protein L6452_22139 [Arctium lappa]
MVFNCPHSAVALRDFVNGGMGSQEWKGIIPCEFTEITDELATCGFVLEAAEVAAWVMSPFSVLYRFLVEYESADMARELATSTLKVLPHDVKKPKKRAPVSFGGRSSSEKPQRSRSVSFSSDRPRARGRSPAFNALASKFDNPGGRNLSTPPPLVKKLYPKVGDGEGGGGGGGGRTGGNLDISKIVSKSKAIASLTASFDKPTREKLMPRSLKVKSESTAKPELNSKANPMSSRIGAQTTKEDTKENEVEDEEGLTIYPYERLTTSSTDPAPDIDVTKREIYLSSAEFKKKFGMTKDAFRKMPKWKQNKMKSDIYKESLLAASSPQEASFTTDIESWRANFKQRYLLQVIFAQIYCYSMRQQPYVATT